MKSAQYYKPARQTGFTLVVIGMILHAFTALGHAIDGVGLFAAGLMLWSWLPYLVPLLLLLWLRNPVMPLCGVLGPFALDMLVYYHLLFDRHQSSTNGLVFFFAPLWSLIILEPIGLLVGWPIGWLVAKRWPPSQPGAQSAPPQ